MSLYFLNLPRPDQAEPIDNMEELDKQFSVLYKIHNSGEYAVLQEMYES